MLYIPLSSSPFFSSSFIIPVLHHPHCSSPGSSLLPPIIFVVYPHSLLSSSFNFLILHHPYPLSSSSSCQLVLLNSNNNHFWFRSCRTQEGVFSQYCGQFCPTAPEIHILLVTIIATKF